MRVAVWENGFHERLNGCGFGNGDCRKWLTVVVTIEGRCRWLKGSRDGCVGDG